MKTNALPPSLRRPDALTQQRGRALAELLFHPALHDHDRDLLKGMATDGLHRIAVSEYEMFRDGVTLDRLRGARRAGERVESFARALVAYAGLTPTDMASFVAEVHMASFVAEVRVAHDKAIGRGYQALVHQQQRAVRTARKHLDLP